MKAVLFVSHGSRIAQTKTEVQEFVKILKKRSGLAVFEYAFLEIESPNIPEGIDICVQKGATQITLLLNFLNAGRHVSLDIPRIVKEASLKYPKVEFTITKPIGQYNGIVDLFLDLLK